MDKWILWFLKKFSPLLEKFGIDTGRMFAIVETKLVMDKRRVYLQMRNQAKKKDENANRLTAVLLMYGLMSAFVSFVLAFMPEIMIGLIVFHSYLFFMMTMTLVMDFSTILLDTTDNMVILPRPVTSKTVFAARMMHIFIYLLQFAVAMCLIPVITVAVTTSVISGLAMLITSGLTILLAVFFTYLLYLLVLRYANEQKLREIITYVQIFMTILFFGAYQVLPRMINLSDLGAAFSLSWYSYFAPPVWMALTIEAVEKNIFDTLHVGMILLAVFLPVILFWLLNKYLAPAFSRKLAAVQTDGSIQGEGKLRKRHSKRLSEKISPLVCNSTTERAAFELTWKITGRDKQFRLQFYPSIGYMIVMVFIFLFRSDKPFSEFWATLPETNNFLWFIYLPLFIIANSLPFVAFNDNYQAAWIYHSSPVNAPGQLVSGSLKAVFVKFFIPVFIIAFLFCLSVWKFSIIDDFVYGLFIVINCFVIIANLSQHYLPFSREPNVQQQSGKFLLALLQMIIIGLLIGLHYLILKFPVLLYCIAPLAILSAYFLIKRIQTLPWQKISL